MSKFERVEFKTSDGVTLRGNFYRAEGEMRPVILMTAGFSLLKEHGLTSIAEAFQSAGFSALPFDYRGWGSSEGAPFQQVDMFQQAEDYRDAVTFAATLPGVDPGKVVLWGIGHGGGDSIIAAADDPRPAAVLLQSPILSGRRDAEMWPTLMERAWKNRETQVLSGDAEHEYVQIWPETLEEANDPDLDIVFKGDLAYDLYQENLASSSAAGTPWENKVTLRSLLDTSRTEPRDFVYKIKQPTLWTAFQDDPFTGTAEWHREAFGKLGPNGEFEIVERPTDATSFEEIFASMTPAQIAYLNRIL